MGLSERAATSDRYFEKTWAAGDDPWDHAGRWYEARKYALTVAVLPHAHYERSFEPGCGAGVLTRLVAARSGSHLAMERHPRGVAATALRCADLPQVEVRLGAVPADWPTGTFDLIVLSEILYYLDGAAIETCLRRCRTSLRAGGQVVAVHYRPVVREHTWTGDEVHDRLQASPGWDVGTQVLDPEFRLDVLRPVAP